MTNRRLTASLVTAGVLLALTSCSSDTSDPKACKAAMAQQLNAAMAAGDQATPGTRPSACDGVDAKALERITGEVLADQAGAEIDASLEANTPGATASSLPPECRAWLESELLDTSDSINAEVGQAACGDLTDAEMDQAIEDVTDDLSEQGDVP